MIRAIGPATHTVMSMGDLRAAAVAAGLENVRTLLATGNLLFEAAGREVDIRRTLEGIVGDFGLTNEVFVRQPEEIVATIEANPFPLAAARRLNHLLVLFLHRMPSREALDRLAGYEGPEHARVVGREVFIDYVEGVGRSKLTAAVLERRLGLTGTARNWNTVGKLLQG
ncbi:MAG: DUF1697 domain-containing protein [Azospirillaceae bacterium]